MENTEEIIEFEKVPKLGRRASDKNITQVVQELSDKIYEMESNVASLHDSLHEHITLAEARLYEKTTGLQNQTHTEMKRLSETMQFTCPMASERNSKLSIFKRILWSVAGLSLSFGIIFGITQLTDNKKIVDQEILEQQIRYLVDEAIIFHNEQ